MLPIISRAAKKVGGVTRLAKLCKCNRQNLYLVRTISPTLGRRIGKATGWSMRTVHADMWKKR